MPGFSILPNANGDKTLPHTLETARRNRYRITFMEPLGTEVRFAAFKCGRPHQSFARMTMHRGQDEVHWPGKTSWEPIRITFYEIIGSSGTVSTLEQLRQWWAERTLVFVSSKIKTNFRVDARIEMLDGFGRPTWEYVLYNAWLQDRAPCDLDYTESGISETTIILSYDRADEQPRTSEKAGTNPSCPQSGESTDRFVSGIQGGFGAILGALGGQ